MFDKKRKARLRWACRRGMLELDVLLTRFYENGFDALSDDELVIFEDLLTCDDPDLFAWFMGHQECENEQHRNMIKHILEHAKV